jgi:N-carbamoyl-L-amino-acid hydrolase
VQSFVDTLATQIAKKYGVRFEFGTLTGSEPATMDAHLLERFDIAAKQLNISHLTMPSGAGHDAAVFAGAGIPAAMIFVRNQNGSHNPDEAMNMADFELAVRVMAHGIFNLN